MELKACMKTISRDLDLDYDKTFASPENFEIRRRLHWSKSKLSGTYHLPNINPVCTRCGTKIGYPIMINHHYRVPDNDGLIKTIIIGYPIMMVDHYRVSDFRPASGTYRINIG